MARRLFIIVLDDMGLGGGDGDTEHTIDRIEATGKLRIPNLRELGLGRLLGDAGDAAGAFGRVNRTNPGGGVLSGMWELCGIETNYEPPTYPAGFPQKQVMDIENFAYKRILGNLRCSGVEALMRFGKEHLRGGGPIVFTTGGSVMYIAGHVSVMDANRLQEICEYARRVMHGEHAVGRIVALPFDGYGEDFRFVEGHAEYAAPPPGLAMTEALSKRWLDVIGIGRAYGLLCGRGLTKSLRPVGDRKALDALLGVAEGDFAGLCLTVLNELRDENFGADAEIYAHALTDFDYTLGRLRGLLRRDDAVILTSGLNNSRRGEANLPVLVFGPGIKRGVSIGVRETLADISAFAFDYFEMPQTGEGVSFYPLVKS